MSSSNVTTSETSTGEEEMELIQQTIAYALVIGCALFGIGWGLVNTLLIRATDMEDHSHLRAEEGEEHATHKTDSASLLARMKEINELIERGAITFLKQEYLFLAGFLALFAVILVFCVEPSQTKFPYTTVAFLIGGSTSILAGYIGMRIAVYTNVRTTKECCEDIHKGFVVAYRGG
mmetsp:Transcript_9011/g.6780  ORF Transcript_9011/g.6780 Transcript_9011/m.6780 type:complete len:177 (+) Transcript_9011:34-564(+)